ncbi:protein phosphatase CheZ [Steroidobacter agaridevorans]|uniref:Protein phosphatase CheZ n=1 Tax=Steroidobacter agaridevorans TaxID=2695856 RepID=A0A829YIM6_9GAMM|nr:protein phosphatase CheZ [Steroidobacter agaridevorans]GFE83185.1 protein phosphatase CheZ [Steroidobacter agaridevorans]
MTSGIEALRNDYGSSIATLAGALAAGDEHLFLSELDLIVHRRERTLFSELRKLTGDLQSALDRFSVDSRLVDLAEKEVPDARARLDHVLKMTDEAAHRTMDLVEQCGPLADRTSRSAGEIAGMWTRFRARKIEIDEFRLMIQKMDAFLAASRTDMDKVRGNLTEVLMAQGYQDLSGQIIRGVMKLVAELETALVNLVRLSRTGPHALAPEKPEPSDGMSRGFGPAVPGVDNGPSASSQDDVDSLLAGLGM